MQFSQRPLLVTNYALYISCGDLVASVQLGQTPKQGQGRALEALLGRLRDEDLDGTRLAAENKIPYRYREGLLDYGLHLENDVFRRFLVDLKRVFADSVIVSQKLKEFEKAGLQGLDEIAANSTPGPVYDWEETFQAPVEVGLVPINQVKLKEWGSKSEMQKHVKEGTPFCGLRLHEPKQIELPKGLPVTGRMKKHGIKSFSTLKEVREANFDLFSDQVFSLSSARTSLASSILSYYRQKRVGEKMPSPSDGDYLMVTHRSQQSSRKSSVISLSPRSSAASTEG